MILRGRGGRSAKKCTVLHSTEGPFAVLHDHGVPQTDLQYRGCTLTCGAFQGRPWHWPASWQPLPGGACSQLPGLKQNLLGLEIWRFDLANPGFGLTKFILAGLSTGWFDHSGTMGPKFAYTRA
jgi:hypothetical protein